MQLTHNPKLTSPRFIGVFHRLWPYIVIIKLLEGGLDDAWLSVAESTSDEDARSYFG
jgi:hypothetical protein